MDRVWPGIFTAEGNLRVQVSALRKALRAGHEERRYILSVSNRGYSFVAPVTRVSDNVPAAATRNGKFVERQARCNLPIVHDRVVGREEDTQRLIALVCEHPLVSIVGPGGVGKTTLAISAASKLLNHRSGVARHGVFFIDLASLSDPGLIVSTLASTLAIGTMADDTMRHVVSFLEEKELLLVIDNCEHLIDEVVHVVEHIIRNVPKVHILTTSREPLRIAGERVHLLRPLVLPSGGGLSASQAIGYSAIELFVERARSRAASFALSNDNADAIGEICRPLDGIPLAIEMAAGRIDCLGVHGLTTALRFDVFGTYEGTTHRRGASSSTFHHARLEFQPAQCP